MRQQQTSLTGEMDMETIVEGSEHTGDGMGHGMDMSDHLMSPYLFGNLKPFFLLFREAKITTGGHLAAAIVVTIVFTMVVTLFSFYAKYLEKKASESAKRFSLVQISATFAFATRMFFHYIVMLLTMSMSVYVILAVTSGHALGYIVYNVAFPNGKEEACDH